MKAAVVLFLAAVGVLAIFAGGTLLLSWLDWREFWEEEEKRGRRTEHGGEK